MKARIVIVSLMASIMALPVVAQRGEYDDMYFTGKDREKNKAIEAQAITDIPAKSKKKISDENTFVEEDANPTDSYSARSINPEYVSRAHSEQASEDEGNYYVEGYTPATGNSFNPSYNNGYYNNSNWGNSMYAGSRWNSGYYGYRDPFMSPYYGYGYNDPFMNPYYGGSGWSMSISYGVGSFYNPWNYGMGYGYGMGNPYYGGYGYNPYYAGNYYYGGAYETSRPNYGKRPSRHSAVVSPTQRPTRGSDNVSSTNRRATVNRTSTRQTADEYYVRPARRTSTLDNSSRNSYSRPSGTMQGTQGTIGTRTRDAGSAAPRENRPVYTPSNSGGSSGGASSPSRSSGGGGGGSSPRPRGN